jgi:urocanate hydratase
LVDLGSDQTSCHDPFGGGYYPAQLGFDEANQANKILSFKKQIKNMDVFEA